MDNMVWIFGRSKFWLLGYMKYIIKWLEYIENFTYQSWLSIKTMKLYLYSLRTNALDLSDKIRKYIGKWNIFQHGYLLIHTYIICFSFFLNSMWNVTWIFSYFYLFPGYKCPQKNINKLNQYTYIFLHVYIFLGQYIPYCFKLLDKYQNKRLIPINLYDRNLILNQDSI